MKRLLAFFAGGLGLGALLGRRSRRALEAAPVTDSPADELRQRLADARATEPEESAPEAPAATPETLDERRASVHDRARSAIDELSTD